MKSKKKQSEKNNCPKTIWRPRRRSKAYPRRHGKYPHVITRADLAQGYAALTRQLNDDRHAQIITDAGEYRA